VGVRNPFKFKKVVRTKPLKKYKKGKSGMYRNLLLNSEENRKT